MKHTQTDPPDPATGAAAVGNSRADAGSLVLVVDDSLSNLRTVSNLLTEHGYDVRGAPDGPTALMIAREEPPDLILLDILIPGMDGYEVCQQLKSHPTTCHIPVIFLSALDEEVDKIKGFELGGVDYITKPFKATEMLARVRTHLSIYKLRADLSKTNQELQRANTQLAHEISERRQVEQSLRLSQTKYRALVNRIPETNGIARVLVVGDDEYLRQATLRLLTQDGHHVIEATTGGDGLRLAMEHTPDLILLDVVPPDTTGIEICRRIKAEPALANSFVVLISSYKVGSEERAVGLESGADEYIIRPISNREFLARIQSLVRLKYAQDALRDSCQFVQATIDAMAAHIAILDGSGTILAVNASWRDFADRNGLAWEDYGVGRNYLETVASAAGAPAEGALEAAQGIRKVMMGQRDMFSLEYPCHSPGRACWFAMHVSRFEDRQGVRVVVLHSDITERKQAENALRARTHELGERVKELNCLYGISALVERENTSLEEILQGTAYLMPSAWQYPEITCARVILNDQEYRSENFQETPWQQTHDISVHGEPRGKIQICYREARPQRDDGPFLKEEESLLNAIAERLGRIVERLQVKAELQESEARLKARYNGIPIPVYTWQRNGDDVVLIDYNNAAATVTHGLVDDFLGIKASEMYQDRPDIVADLTRCLTERCQIEREMSYRFKTTGVTRQLAVKYAFVPPDLVLAHIEDITARKHTEEIIHQRVEELSALHRIAQTVATTADLPTALQPVARTMTDLFDAQAVLVTLATAGEVEMEILARFERSSDPCSTTTPVLALNEMPLTRRMLEQGQTTVLPNLQALAMPIPVRAYVSALDLHALMLVPLRARGAVIGALVVAADQVDRTFTPDEVNLAETIASDIAAAVDNARLAEKARVAAVDAERQRLARELHDSVTQSLYSITLLSNGWGTMAEQGRLEDPVGSFRQLGDVGQQALKEMRLLIHQLRSPILDEVGLVGALQQRLDAVEKRAGVEARLLTQGDVESIPHPVEEQLYHIAQEGLNNALRHANATTVTVQILASVGQVFLSLDDDGIGFDPDTDSAGMGLTNMRDRAVAIGGAVTITSAPHRGTTVEVAIALEPDIDE